MMAARRNLAQTELTKDKIRTSQLINRLQNHALGKNKMSATQLQAARILLAKTLPDLRATEHSGEVETGAVKVIIGS